jgi:GTPase SAR1 family protein
MIYDTFEDEYVPTPNTSVSKVDFAFPYEDGSEMTLEMDVWDITGEKAFREFLVDAYFLRSKAIIAVFDAARPDTLDALGEWVDQSLEIAHGATVHTLVNKMDMKPGGVYADPALKVFCQRYNSAFYLVSAKTGLNVDAAFQQIAMIILKHVSSELDKEEKTSEKEWEILNLVAKRGKLGASKEFFFAMMKGVAFDTLTSYIEELERKGYLRVNWSSSSDFIAYVTETGLERAKGGPLKYDGSYVDTVV